MRLALSEVERQMLETQCANVEMKTGKKSANTFERHQQ